MDEIIKKKLARNWFKTLQEVLCKEIEELEGGSKLFKFKNWERDKKSNEGGGQSRIYENGKIFDKVGVNFSEVYGKFSNQFKNKIPGTNKTDFPISVARPTASSMAFKAVNGRRYISSPDSAL